MEQPWEHSLLERKTEGYKDKEFLRTFVAFANSVYPEDTALVLIGEKDSGEVVGVENIDNLQKRVRKIFDQIYPDPNWKMSVYSEKDKYCLRVEIRHSENAPHFGGEAWIRKGSETIKATDEIFQKLVETRLSKVREIAKSIGRQVSVSMDRYSFPGTVPEYSMIYLSDGVRRWYEHGDSATVLSVNAFYVDLQRERDPTTIAEPLDRVLISFDHVNNRLELIIKFKS